MPCNCNQNGVKVVHKFIAYIDIVAFTSDVTKVLRKKKKAGRAGGGEGVKNRS